MAESATIRAAATAFLQRQNIAGGTLQLQVPELDRRLHLAGCNQPLETQWAAGSRKIGAVTVAVRCTGSAGWTVMVPASVRLQLPVVVAAHPLRPGATLSATDVTVRAADVTDLNNQYLSNAGDAIGKRLVRGYASGDALNPNALAQPILVKRGNEVIVRVGIGGLEVQASGKALNDGAIGQRVRIQNVKSLRIIEGSVLADGSVKISM